MDLMQIEDFLNKKAIEFNFLNFGITPLARPLTIEFYQEWINQNLYGEMSYLKDHLPYKENPQRLLELAKKTKMGNSTGAEIDPSPDNKNIDTNSTQSLQSAFVFAAPYFPAPHAAQTPLRQLRTALYAQNLDYHYWFKDQLNKISIELSALFPNEVFMSFTDSGPILERDLAKKAGLGWFGKNTCLIDPKKGSLFFIGEILTSLRLEPVLAMQPDFCGTCTRCIDICPTQAITEPHQIDARKCISYLTIESRQVPTVELRDKMGDWFFGCDLCQTVCPWNQKVFKNIYKPDRHFFSTEMVLKKSENEKTELIDDLRFILTSSGKQLQKAFKQSPLLRAGPFGLRRNAIVIIANRKIIELAEEVEKFTADPKLGELALWCLDQLKSDQS